MTEEIILNHLTMHEWGWHHDKSPRDDWEHYSDLVKWMFRIKELYFFESELLQEYKVQTIEELLSFYPAKFAPAGNRNKHLKDFSTIDLMTKRDEVEKIKKERGGWIPEDYEQTWFDLSLARFEITPEDPYHDEFFVYQLRNLDLLEIDNFLDYQLRTHFENDIDRFKRFVVLSLRKHGQRLMLPEQLTTVNEWLMMINEGQKLSGIEEEVIKVKKTKITRHPGDGLTALNAVQIAYLINLLKQTKVIIQDD